MENKFNKLISRVMLRDCGATIWIALLFVISSSILIAVSGCLNIYTRCPCTESKIERVYQCSREVAAMSMVAAWPQMMSDNPGNKGFRAENMVTIPIGCVGMCSAACEAVIDTVCLPADWIISDFRKEEKGVLGR